MNPIFPELPSKLGIYTLTELLGAREYSELYLAKQSYVERAVVIEVLRPGSGAEMEEWFREGARNRAGVTLPRVSPVFESVQTGSICYMIQEQPEGEPLSRRVGQGKFLTVEQGFALVRAVAELYAACMQRDLAANPLGAESIYLDEDGYHFLSPLTVGHADETYREAQMQTLADVLEYAVEAEDLKVSKLAVVLHWLRNGYGGRALEWAPLISALHTMVTKKGAGGEALPDQAFSSKSILRFGKRRYLKRAWRFVVHMRLWIAGCLGLVAALGLCGFLIPSNQPSANLLSAVTDEAVYCEQDGVQYRVSKLPVSVKEYGELMEKWKGMSAKERTDLLKGLPVKVKDYDPKPLDWEQQETAADEALEKGFLMPVSGVSYWDAVVYARSIGEELASADFIKTARQYANQEKNPEEWTSTLVQGKLPYGEYRIVFPGNEAESCRPGGEPDTKVPGRSFRTVKRIKKN